MRSQWDGMEKTLTLRPLARVIHSSQSWQGIITNTKPMQACRKVAGRVEHQRYPQATKHVSAESAPTSENI